MKIIYILIGLALLISGLYVANEGVPLSVTDNTVTVYVRYGSLGIEDALVKLIPDGGSGGIHIEHTGPLGMAQISGVDAGAYTLQVITEEYGGYVIDIYVATTTTINVQLEDEGTYPQEGVGVIKGQVISKSTGLGVPGAVVHAGSNYVDADSNGVYYFELPAPATYTLQATANGLNTEIKTFQLAIGMVINEPLQINDAAYLVTFLVLDASESAEIQVSDATISITGWSGTGYWGTGGYTAQTISYGVHSYVVNANGFYSNSGTFTVTQDYQHIKIYMTPIDEVIISGYGTLTGHVYVDGTTTPIANAFVSAHDASGNMYNQLTTAEGLYEMNIPAGSYMLGVTATGFEAYYADVSCYVEANATQTFDVSLVSTFGDGDTGSWYDDIFGGFRDGNNITGIFLPTALIVIGLICLFVGFRRR